MKNKINIFILVLIGLFFCIKPVSSQKEFGPTKYSAGSKIETLAYDFTLMDLQQNKVVLSSFKGKKNVLLVFWATWCPSCKQEIPKLNAFVNKYKQNDLVILAIDVDKRERADFLRRFVVENKINYKVLLDNNEQVGNQYQILGIPTNIIINKKGIIKFRDYYLPEDLKEFGI